MLRGRAFGDSLAVRQISERDGGETRLKSPARNPASAVAPRVLEHAQEDAELDAVGMRLDLAGLGRQLVDRPRVLASLPLGRVVDERHVRVGDGRLLEVLVHRGPAPLVAPLDLERHLGAAVALPVDLLVLEDPRLVLLGVDLHLEVVGRGAGAGARGDLDRLPGRELSVHAGRGDADPLLAPAHAQPVELRAVEELGEDRRDLVADDAGAVVDDGDAEPRRLAGGGRRRPVARHDLDLDRDVGEDAGLLGRVEGVVHRLLDAGEEGLARAVEAEEVPVLGEELGDGDLALAGAHLDGGDAGLRWRRGRPGLGQRLRVRHCLLDIRRRPAGARLSSPEVIGPRTALSAASVPHGGRGHA